MKKLFLLLVAAMTIVGCATSEERAARQAEHMEKVKAAVDGQQYKINMREMIPLRSSSIHLSGMNYLKVNGKNDYFSYLSNNPKDYDLKQETYLCEKYEIRNRCGGYRGYVDGIHGE